jgi:hypothetical protein
VEQAHVRETLDGEFDRLSQEVISVDDMIDRILNYAEEEL